MNTAIQKIVADNGRLDVVIHNAGHMVFGPAEAFTPEQFAELYDINVLSTQRVNRAALPQLRKQKQGLVIWVSSSSSAGGTPPYLATYFAAKARWRITGAWRLVISEAESGCRLRGRANAALESDVTVGCAPPRAV